jgi:thiamine biosynthesis protein ThiS
MPEITFNGEKRKLEDGSSAEVFLRQAGFEPASLIVVLNGDVVETADLAAAKLKDGDALDLLKLAGGG